MLKRFTKVTSLLVVAASVMSTIPTMAVECQKLETQEGTIYGASAKGNGKFIIDGEIDGQDSQVYYLDNGKYNKLENADSGDTIGDIKCGKYLDMNNAEYYVDLTTGETTDEDIEDNYEDDVATTLRKKLKKDNDGRLADSEFSSKTVSIDKQMRQGNNFMMGIAGNWCQFEYKLKTSDIDGWDYTSIITDADGNYLDADYNLGSIKVVTTGGSFTLKNTKDTYELKEGNTTYEYKAQIKKYEPLLYSSGVYGAYAESWDSIYRQASLKIYKRQAGQSNPYVNVTNLMKFGNSNNAKSLQANSDVWPDADTMMGDPSITVFQKMSKVQASDDVDGLKYPKKVETYFITDSDGKAQPLLGSWEPKNAGLDFSDVAGDDVSMIGGSLSGDLMSGYFDKSEQKVYAETLTFKSENGFNYTDVSDAYDTDCEAWALGNGEFYCFAKGYIRKWNYKDGYDKLYKVDGSMTNLSVSDPLNLICWDEDNECYSIVSHDYTKDAAATPATTTPATTTPAAATPLATAGWVQAAEGTWSYNKVDGTKATGWLLDGSTWYYLNASGEMLANTTVDGYILGANGAWIK